jgi:hypothetical protein
MEPPKTRSARVGTDRLAYQVLGQGPPDLVVTMGAFSQVDAAWEAPQMALFLRRLASYSRLLRLTGAGPAHPTRCRPTPAAVGATQRN